MKSLDSYPIPKTTLHSPLLYVAALLLLAAAAFSFPGLPTIWDPDAHQAILKSLYDSGVGGNALQTWLWVDLILRAGALLLPGSLAACLFLTLLPQIRGGETAAARGLGILRIFCRILAIVLMALSVFLAGLFLWRMTAYLIRCAKLNHGVFLAFGMIFYECILGALSAVALYFLIRTLLNACDTMDTLRYTTLVGRPEAAGIHTGVMTMLWTLGILGSIVGLTRLPEQAACLSFQCSALALILLAVFLRRYRRRMERLAWRMRQEAQETL